MIDQLVEAMAGHELLSFMDAYSDYNQIKMHPPDEDKTAFTTGQGIYCYRVMPFELKNARATFQRMVKKVFKNLIGSTMEVYVDDMLVNSIQRADHLQHLDKAFNLFRQYKVKLNPENARLGWPPGDSWDIWSLNGASKPTPTRYRFISWSTDKCSPFFQVLKKNGADPFWNEECETSFQEQKKYLT